MLTLGLNFSHDSSIALAKNGKLLLAIEEERLSKVKHNLITDSLVDGYTSIYYPFRSLNRMFEVFALKPSEINNVCFSVTGEFNSEGKYQCVDNSIFEKIVIQFGHDFKSAKINKISHHTAHFYSSRAFTNSANVVGVVIDGSGNLLFNSPDLHPYWERTSVFYENNENLTRILMVIPFFYFSTRKSKIVRAINSIGEFYRRFAKAIIAPGNESEGSMMALSSFGDFKKYFEYFMSYVKLLDDGNYKIYDQEFIEYDDTKSWDQDYYLISPTGDKLGYKYSTFNELCDLAAAGQKIFEILVLHIIDFVNRAIPESEIPISLSGGCFLNAKLNDYIVRKYNRKFLFQPASHDGGVSVGAVEYLLRQKRLSLDLKSSTICNWGFPSEPSNEVNASICKMESLDKLLDVITKILIDGGIIGICIEKNEFGPRALGNRSILVDGTRPGIKNKLNHIKQRADYRPFACSILTGDVNDYFILDEPSYFMLRAIKVANSKIEVLQEVLHADQTCRIQVVDKESAFFFRLLEEFKKKTGIPFLINTSLNLKGKPIAQDEVDAIECFKNLKLDALVLNNLRLILANR